MNAKVKVDRLVALAHHDDDHEKEGHAQVAHSNDQVNQIIIQCSDIFPDHQVQEEKDEDLVEGEQEDDDEASGLGGIKGADYTTTEVRY